MKTTYHKEYKALLEKLKLRRKELGLTQKEIADKLAKPQSFVSKIEKG